MKDLVISGKRLASELYFLLGCLVVAFGANIYAVIHYERPFYELFTQIGFTIVTALVLYVLTVLLRLFLRFFVWIFKKITKKVE